MVYLHQPAHQIYSMMNLVGDVLCKENFLQPVLPLEKPEEAQRGKNHESNGRGVSTNPLKLRHVLEVHTIDTGNKCGWHEHYRYNGKYFDNGVLLNVNKTKKCILQIFKTLGTELRVLQQRPYIFNDDLESLILHLVKFRYTNE